MGVISRLSAMMMAGMGKEDKQRLMDEMVTRFFAELTPADKHSLINNWMDKFFADMTTEDKQKIAENIMPKIKDGFNTALIMPQMMTAFMGLGQTNNVSDMMPTMVSKTPNNKGAIENKNQVIANVKTPGECKPWENCPCRKICEDNLKQNQKDVKS